MYFFNKSILSKCWFMLKSVYIISKNYILIKCEKYLSQLNVQNININININIIHYLWYSKNFYVENISCCLTEIIWNDKLIPNLLKLYKVVKNYVIFVLLCFCVCLKYYYKYYYKYIILKLFFLVKWKFSWTICFI